MRSDKSAEGSGNVAQDCHELFVAERRLNIARPFKPGAQWRSNLVVAERRLSEMFKRRSRDAQELTARRPGLESPGYVQSSLRDEEIRTTRLLHCEVHAPLASHSSE
jgi:hypothetical protein